MGRIARNRGFTHVELTAVMTLIAILSAVALPKMHDLASDARHATMRALAGTLTEASVVNGALGPLRADADVIQACRDAGKLLMNADVQADRLLWQDRDLRIDEVAGPQPSGMYRSCEMVDTHDSNAGTVRFMIRTCADRHCNSA